MSTSCNLATRSVAWSTGKTAIATESRVPASSSSIEFHDRVTTADREGASSTTAARRGSRSALPHTERGRIPQPPHRERVPRRLYSTVIRRQTYTCISVWPLTFIAHACASTLRVAGSRYALGPYTPVDPVRLDFRAVSQPSLRLQSRSTGIYDALTTQPKNQIPIPY